MSEITLESLAQRVATLEKELAEQKARSTSKKDWRRTVGMFTGSEFQKQVDAEGQAIRQEDRESNRSDDHS
jgi:hypothetical protein